MENRKYEFTDETIEIDGHVLHRIRAVRDFTLNDYTHIKAGDLGGFVESENNLSHELRCWVSGSAHVYDNARVSGNAQVSDNTWVSGNSQVYDNAHITEKACVTDDACVYDNAYVTGSAKIFDCAHVYGYATVGGFASVCDRARVFESATVDGCAVVRDDAQVCGNMNMSDSNHVGANAVLCGYGYIGGRCIFSTNAYIRSKQDYCTIQGFGSMHRSTTFYNTSREDGKYEISVKCGCFNGTLAEFEARVKETHGDGKYAKEYLIAIELAKAHFDIA